MLRIKIFIVVILLIAITSVIFLLVFNERPMPSGLKYILGRNNNRPLPFYKGETLIYDVYYKKIKVGKSVLTFHGEDSIDGQEVYHIAFSTNIPGFEDIEDIYAYKETFLPFRVFRDIKRMGAFPTRIQERYDQDKFRVDIKEKGMLFSKEFSIQKDAPIHNAILLPYYYRNKPVISDTERFKIVLPTIDFDIILKGKESIQTRSGSYSAYVFSSVPSKFKFWLSTDPKRIPIKIESLTMLDYSLILNSVDNIVQ